MFVRTCHQSIIKSAHYLANFPNHTKICRAGKNLKMSTHEHFEGSEMSSKVRDFRPKKIVKKVHDLRPILNPNPQYILNP